MAENYREQVRLLLRILPLVAEEEVFALKGGTAINLFERDLPRLSVDIDLTYLPFDDRTAALANISTALGRLKARIEKVIPDIHVTVVAQQGGAMEAKLHCQHRRTQVKIEVNTTIRGQLFPTRLMATAAAVQDQFEAFVEVPVISQAELYGGKLCAALDRQHPRDLFDVHYLLNAEGLTPDIKLGLIAGALSHPRPINEVLFPKHRDQREAFERQFAGMALKPFTYDDFEATRRELGAAIEAALTPTDKDFLLSFKQGDPAWELIDLPNLAKMPAVQWKLKNIQSLLKSDPAKHALQLQALAEKLGR
jgi:predicted nucleotidyltransferase component of viral defense system